MTTYNFKKQAKSVSKPKLKNLSIEGIDTCYPKPPVINTSVNYDLFNMVHENRELRSRTLVDLREEFKSNFKLHLFPIVVSKQSDATLHTIGYQYDIIDGQHRFVVAKELGLPIYFIEDVSLQEGKVTYQDIYGVNRAGATWSLKDRILALYKSGNREIALVYELYLAHGERYPLSTVAKISVNFGKKIGGSFSRIIEADSLICKDIEKARTLLNYCDLFKLSFKNKERFVGGLACAITQTGADIDRFLSRVLKNQHYIVDLPTESQMIITLVKAYNYGLKAKSKLRLVG